MKKHNLWISIPLISICTLFLLTTIFTIYDNSRVIVIHQTIEMEGLDPAFDGFTILQISDLHGKRFGEHQKYLANIINALDYDLLAFTGDFQSRQRDPLPLLELIHAIQPQGPMVYVGGNSGPFDVDIFIGGISPDGEMLQKEGCTLLDRPFSIQRGEAQLWFSEVYLGMNPADLIVQAEQQRASRQTEAYMKEYFSRQAAFQKELAQTFSRITPADTLIGITHYPLPQATLDGLDQKTLPFDLVIAGHYHGGQIRLPFIGALYIPDAHSSYMGLFPDQRIVSGLYTGKHIQQYVSRGVGSSDVIPFLNFRSFNTPEINLLTLHRKAEN
jgi:uncharacterized protein